ncbi:energy-coupling factor ABC transporter ATP-binding protein [Lactobacillus sp. ESL0791]|uniref:energy-coupling factor ABC transporter ATP-binding protein n=1 Tax=Lactobacillus sp. ESL0791 TaxID=2983234 RepID=UPI0023F8BBC2|nr:energy-coupling factor ABC transporter ATP-binding protein [Lactobacillus sp. ESL0791]MDF7639422.1 energy-coupling factor ABC transporter ATP-binding protein [Lactobacillus sp. ESL0791]
MADDNIISVKDITFTYPEAQEAAIDDVSFNIKRGSWTAIIGHNGSGKSTLTRLLNGLLVVDNPAESSIEVDGIKLSEQTVWEVRNRIGIVFQNPDNQFVGATVADDVAFGLENRGVPREKMLKIVPEMINEVGMTKYLNAEPESLSGGQKQRVAIAGILAINPQIIILDEATAMLDPEGRTRILEIVKRMNQEAGLTVISITHDIDEASLADQIMVMNDGKIVDQGSVRAVFNKGELLRELGLDVPFAAQVKEELVKAGTAIPASVGSEKELVNYLCQLNSAK